MQSRRYRVMMTLVGHQRRVSLVGRTTAYAACACAFVFAAVSFYWGLGGTFALDRVGREAVELSASGNVPTYIALWLVGVLKVGGGLLALAMVQPWGARRFPRWALLSAGWGTSGLLVLYGGVQIGVQLLVAAGTISTPADMDWRGFYGHLYLWNPWFVVWGVLLGIATFSYTRRTRGQTMADRKYVAEAAPKPGGPVPIGDPRAERFRRD
jgi:hypothetical protein